MRTGSGLLARRLSAVAFAADAARAAARARAAAEAGGSGAEAAPIGVEAGVLLGAVLGLVAGVAVVEFKALDAGAVGAVGAAALAEAEISGGLTLTVVVTGLGAAVSACEAGAGLRIMKKAAPARTMAPKPAKIRPLEDLPDAFAERGAGMVCMGLAAMALGSRWPG